MPDQKFANPASSGPAGSHFEGQVGAHYLLTMLAQSEPRGFPGVQISSVKFQRAAEGHPLDDIIIHGQTKSGENSILEIQVKRSIRFAPSDSVFCDVIKQIGKAVQNLDLSNTRHQFAVATARSSSKTFGPYQDIINWAKSIESANLLMERINRSGVGNASMRAFVDTIRKHLSASQFESGDEVIWQILKRFQILVFDFESSGSTSEELAHERCFTLLHPDEKSKASTLWSVLVEHAIAEASVAGYIDVQKLTEHLTTIESFRFAGAHSNQFARDTLAEVTELAVHDFPRKIGGVELARLAISDRIRTARENGRFIEIRGGAGVGKSGLLRMQIDEACHQSRTIVLSPSRTVGGGWSAFKAQFRIEMPPEDFLRDLASTGGAVLFVDSLDFFDDVSRQITVRDLISAASKISGFQVIVTARTDFGKLDPSWLPTDILAPFGPIETVEVDELSPQEVEELRASSPQLKALLVQGHPAQVVARNLFRLSRLLEMGNASLIKTEVDLVKSWWNTADGPIAGRRDRQRLLADLADALFEGKEYLDQFVAPEIISGLTASGTIRELSRDRFAFRHDVLRDWAIAARLTEDSTRLQKVDLKNPIPPTLTRGLELAARWALEGENDPKKWDKVFSAVIADRVHMSWRRSPLLAILRSEIASNLLDTMMPWLYENNGKLLVELIRTAIAIESKPLRDWMQDLGQDGSKIDHGIHAPSNGSWVRLVVWLVKHQKTLPIGASPDVVSLLQKFTVGTLFFAPFATKTAEFLVAWLEEIEDAQRYLPFKPDAPRFAQAFGHSELFRLAEDTRLAYVLVAKHAPEKAKIYLKRLLDKRYPDHITQDILRYVGTLPEAAPVELVDVTLAALIKKKSQKRHVMERDPRTPFTHLDSDFLPGSPAMGPFLALLQAAPEQGLRLIRGLVAHAVIFYFGSADVKHDSIELELPDGKRSWPWLQSYRWSRGSLNGYAVTSGLLALEAWSHQRIEKGEPVEEVIQDILGPPGSCAAFLQVASDVIISHWPKTASIALPFLGCPELLAIERSRLGHDQLDVGGSLFGLGKEPQGSVTLADLKKRPSRSYALEVLLPLFVVNKLPDLNVLRSKLEVASIRLGAPLSGDSFAVPRLMARHAVNLLIPENWELVDGEYRYVSPTEEASHFQELEASRSDDLKSLNTGAGIQLALEDSSRCTAELLGHAVAYAKELQSPSNSETDVVAGKVNTIVGAALLVCRDGTAEVFAENENWARSVFSEVLKNIEKDSGSLHRNGLRFSPVAIAAAGLIHIWTRTDRITDRNELFDLVTRKTPSAAQGFGAAISAICEKDERLVRSFLRCALVAQVQRIRSWQDEEETIARDEAARKTRVLSAIQREINWLAGMEAEPAWPSIPTHQLSIRQGIRIGSAGDIENVKPSPKKEPTEELMVHSAVRWVTELTHEINEADRAWLVGFVKSYEDWTWVANGGGLEQHASTDNRGGREWNEVYFRLLVEACPIVDLNQFEAIISRLVDVPDEAFYDVATIIVRAADTSYFNGKGLNLDVALKIRSIVSGRLRHSYGWKNARDETALTIEMNLGPAFAVLFFNQHGPFGGSSCYLYSKALENIEPFLPQLTKLIEEGSVPFTSILTMNLLEVSPRAALLPFFLASALKCKQRQPENRQLYIEHGLGKRMVTWLRAVLLNEFNQKEVIETHIQEIGELLSWLAAMGVPEAHALENAIGAMH